MTRGDIEAAVSMVLFVAVVIGGCIWLVVDDVKRTAACEALGGVRVGNQCAKIEIIAPPSKATTDGP